MPMANIFPPTVAGILMEGLLHCDISDHELCFFSYSFRSLDAPRLTIASYISVTPVIIIVTRRWRPPVILSCRPSGTSSIITVHGMRSIDEQSGILDYRNLGSASNASKAHRRFSE